MNPVFPPQPPVMIPTATGEAFPVRRLFCIGRNYEDHAREMGVVADPEAPFFFTKFAEALVGDGGTVAYPPGTRNLHHEVELVAAIWRSGRDIPREEALDYVWGYAVGIDMTRRDLQNQAKEKRQPWDASKNFEASAPVGRLHPAASLGAADRGRIALEVNGEIRQQGELADMINPLDRLIAFLSTLYRLYPGDLIFTGTPAGVGAVEPGDVLVASIEGLTPLRVTIGEPAA